ncbi:MAG: VCBS repeat-containing protein [Chitinophagaceae bacterium]|nr:VCBS repeat-containing protein [Chitinophagaceae bacterium]
MKQLIAFSLVALLLIACKTKQKNDTPAIEEPPVSSFSGKELALTYCSSCHAFVSPELLPTSSWKLSVLPAMGYRMGIYNRGYRPDSLFDPGISGEVVRNANIFPEKPVLAREDWHKIEEYFLKNSPGTILPPVRETPIRVGLKHFRYKETSFSHRPALTTMVKILPDNKGIAYADGKPGRNVLTFLNPDLRENFSLPLRSTPVQFREKSNELYLTIAGNGIFPTDAPGGSLQLLIKNDTGRGYHSGDMLIPNLKRPVCIAYGDLNKDGLEDAVVCEFGNQTGELAWFQHNQNGGYTKNVLRSKPGAITAIIKDANRDGLPDIYVLMAQADEAIFLYENLGAGRFKEKRLLSFPPLYGSQHIELADFNKDGFDDIVYVCGDNADKTPILKKYHGIYIFLNDGKNNFRQSYFYQMNGAYKAIVSDYDLDGDPDIAAISFFPDYRNYATESFIYLENKGHLKFDDYSFPEATKGRWIVMDAGDMDADGDTDLVLGSFVYFIADGDTTGLGKKWLTTGPSVIVLENTIR